MEMSELRIPPDAMVFVGASPMQHGTDLILIRASQPGTTTGGARYRRADPQIGRRHAD
jgi:hypothetical protein